jgi:hypothetical protein
VGSNDPEPAQPIPIPEEESVVSDSRPTSPVWLRALGGVVLALMGAGTLYAVVVGLLRFGAIGV